MTGLALTMRGGGVTAATTARPAPRPPRRTGPLLMADILTSPGGVPTLLRAWREDEGARGDGSER